MVCKERTLILIKPDGVKRCLVGRIISRFEDSGMKIVGMRLTHVPQELAANHYTQDIAERRGEHVRNALLSFITSGPVVALCVEGVNAIENVRKLVGSTEPKAALPGTIRGDFTHVSFQQADHHKKAVANVIHASADKDDAAREVGLWFNEDELQTYETVHEVLTF
ncbi:nucleoside-diphosphate kinase [Candidatus Woesearchaeota archaeon]|nr:nucleoside-diphosphate kinase [Candidatus Woesearchaeota archaeon]